MHEHRFLGLVRKNYSLLTELSDQILVKETNEILFFKNHLPAPKIFGGEINLVETQELKIPGNEVPGGRNIHHISPKQNFQFAQNQHPTPPRPRSSQAPHTEVLMSFSSFS